MGRYTLLGKPNRELSPSDLERGLRLCGWMSLEYRAYAVLVYWVGCRRVEPLSLVKEDIRQTEDFLFISNLVASKHGKRAEALRLPIALVGLDLIAELAEGKKKGQKLFTFCERTAYNVTMQILQVYPHWMRYNRVTNFRRLIDERKISTDDAKAFTGIRSDRTMQTYGMTSNEGAARAGDALASE